MIIIKSAQLAKEKPWCFLLLGWIAFLFALFFILALFAILLKFTSIGQYIEDWIVLSAFFIPIMPFFYFLGFMTAEWYFNLFKIGWVLGFHKRPVANGYLRWASRRHKRHKRMKS